MLSGEAVERQQRLAVLDQAFDCLRILRCERFNEQIEGLVRLCLRLGHPDIVQHRLALPVKALRHLVQDVRRLVNPAPLTWISQIDSAVGRTVMCLAA